MLTAESVEGFVICLHCGVQFIPSRKGMKYCSPRCGNNYRTLKHYHEKKKHTEKHKERERQRSKKRWKNPEHRKYMLNYGRQHRELHRALYRSKDAKRRARELSATPSWADMELIKDVYIEANYFGYEVDHIIPLQSKLVCGLHVWENLQILPMSENRSKGNKYAILDC